jgi:hypothetical protein
VQTSETFQIFKDRVAVLIHPVWPALLLASGGRDHCVGICKGTDSERMLLYHAAVRA